MKPATSPSASDLSRQFAMAARQHELAALTAMAETGHFVILSGQLIHALQKERGYSNMFLCSDNISTLTSLNTFSELSLHKQEQLCAMLKHNLSSSSATWHNTRLLNAVAHTLFRLDEIALLRERIRRRDIDDLDAIAQFSKPISSLLNMVFEAMNGATDPDITRQLVALFNFMQGKELCGQERACGVSAFAAGLPDNARKMTLRNLQQMQHRSFLIFSEYASPAALARWQGIQNDETALQRLRLLSEQSHPAQSFDSGMTQLWFDVTTARIDALHTLETELANQLSESCTSLVKYISNAIADQAQQQGSAIHGQTQEEPTAAVLYSLHGQPLDTASSIPMNQSIAYSLLDQLHAQTQRLQQADDALLAARQEQLERRFIEQVKWQLVSTYRISEPEALERMQRIAMNHGMGLHDVARQLSAEMGK